MLAYAPMYAGLLFPSAANEAMYHLLGTKVLALIDMAHDHHARGLITAEERDRRCEYAQRAAATFDAAYGWAADA